MKFVKLLFVATTLIVSILLVDVMGPINEPILPTIHQQM